MPTYTIELDAEGQDTIIPPAPDTIPSNVTEHMAALDLEYTWREQADDAWSLTIEARS